jgi:hypothetical protein
MVTVADENGAHILRYLRLCGDMYFGGNTWSRADGFEAGVHAMRGLKGMLYLVAKIANTPAVYPYTLEGRYCLVQISREMNAADLAKVFCCDEQVIHDHFAPLVSLT